MLLLAANLLGERAVLGLLTSSISSCGVGQACEHPGNLETNVVFSQFCS